MNFELIVECIVAALFGAWIVNVLYKKYRARKAKPYGEIFVKEVTEEIKQRRRKELKDHFHAGGFYSAKERKGRNGHGKY